MSDKILPTRITSERIDGVVDSAQYLGPFNGRLTICILTLRNGYMVIGESCCVSRENYVESLGQKLAHDDARDKIWALEGYALRSQLNLKAGD